MITLRILTMILYNDLRYISNYDFYQRFMTTVYKVILTTIINNFYNDLPLIVTNDIYQRFRKLF